jgi:hypothetical protein
MISKIKAFFAKLFSKKQPSVSVIQKAFKPQFATVLSTGTDPVVAVEDELPDNLRGVMVSTAASETPTAAVRAPKVVKNSPLKKKKTANQKNRPKFPKY